ncbi:hypothetical protein NCW37_004757 [Salmonella enterica]|nr:hypothetical protein [Salmonella enterica]
MDLNPGLTGTGLTDPQQRVMAGYDKPETHPDRPVMTHRIVDEETYLASR